MNFLKNTFIVLVGLVISVLYMALLAAIASYFPGKVGVIIDIVILILTIAGIMTLLEDAD